MLSVPTKRACGRLRSLAVSIRLQTFALSTSEGWDLSGQDLRGFDLTNCDLRSTNISEAITDETTKLDGAQWDTLPGSEFDKLASADEFQVAATIARTLRQELHWNELAELTALVEPIAALESEDNQIHTVLKDPTQTWR